RHRPPRIDAAKPGGHRPAAGIPRNPHVTRIDFLATQQIIQGADPVPGAPRAKKLADQELLVADHQVFFDSRPDWRSKIAFRKLQPLPLSNRVEDQDDITLPS